MLVAKPLVRNQKSRAKDDQGSGQYGASRKSKNGKKYEHLGLDIVTTPNEVIFSPISGSIEERKFPYADDLSLEGLSIKGSGEWSGYKITLFYVTGLRCGAVAPGEAIAIAQDLKKKYSDITNHVHMQVTRNGKIIDPREMYWSCF